MKFENPWKRRNRDVKLAALLRVVPLADTLQLREELARAIEKPGTWRDLLASAADVRSPSEETWAELAVLIRARPISSEAQVSRAAHLRRVS
jgi:hypothetical protein